MHNHTHTHTTTHTQPHTHTHTLSHTYTHTCSRSCAEEALIAWSRCLCAAGVSLMRSKWRSCASSCTLFAYQFAYCVRYIANVVCWWEQQQQVCRMSCALIRVWAGRYKHIYKYIGSARTMYIRNFWQANHQIYGHIQCVYIRFWPTLHVHFINTYTHWRMVLRHVPLLVRSCSRHYEQAFIECEALKSAFKHTTIMVPHNVFWVATRRSECYP